MSVISIIVAVAENGVIGANNDLPWRLPDDLKHFKRLTTDNPVIMGRNTWESLGKPLPNRTNIVVTQTEGYVATGATVVTSLQSALAIAGSGASNHAFVIGGAMLFKEALPVATNCFITEVHANVEGDVYFPEFDKSKWSEVSRKLHPADEQHAYSFDFVHWIRDPS